MEPDIRMLDKYKSELKDMDRNISLLQSKLQGVGEPTLPLTSHLEQNVGSGEKRIVIPKGLG